MRRGEKERRIDARIRREAQHAPHGVDVVRIAVQLLLTLPEGGERLASGDIIVG